MKRHRRDPVLDVLAHVNPAPTRPLSDSEQERARVLLAGAKAAGLNLAPAAVSTRRSRWNAPIAGARRRVGLTVAAIVTALVVAVPATAPASAQAVLLQAARNAGDRPAAAGEYWHVRSQIEDPYSIPYIRESWHSSDRQVVRDQQAAAVEAYENGQTAIDPDRVRVREVRDDRGAVPQFGEDPTFTWEELEALPTDPDLLRSQLTHEIARSARGADWDLWQQAVSMLQESPASPALRRALWQILASTPGTQLDANTTDASGRSAVAVTADFTDIRQERFVILLDPTTGTLLESRVLEPDGSLAFQSTVLESGWSSAAPEAQPPLCGPGSVPAVSC